MKRCFHGKFLTTFISFYIFSTAAAFGQSPFTHTAMFHSGQAAPGTPAGVTFGSTGTAMTPPWMGGDGTTLVFSSLAGPGIVAGVNDNGAFAAAPNGTLQYVARDGDVAPGTGGALFDSTSQSTSPNIGSNGTIAFRGSLVIGGPVTSANNNGIWSGTPGNMQLVARTGDVAAGTSGATYASVGSSYLAPDGRVIHTGLLVQGGPVTSANDFGVWISAPGNSTLWMREGDIAPGTGGAIFSQLSPTFFGTGPAGVGVFRNTLVVGGTVTTSNNNGLWLGTPGNLQLVMRTGDVAPGTGGGVFLSLGTSTVLATGQALTSAMLQQGGAITSANDAGIWIGTTTANLQLAAREGDAVSGLPAGVYASTFGVPQANGNHVAFRSALAGTGVTTANDNAVVYWSATTGLRIVAREGDVAPGTGGALFGAIGTASPLFLGTQPDISGSGLVSFYAPLTGAGVTTSNDAGIWVWNNGTITLVVRKGDVVDVDPGPGVDLATIANLTTWDEVVGPMSGYAGFDNNDRLGWLATLTDGRTAAFVTAVPEPITVMLFGGAIGAAGIWWIRRRRIHAKLVNAETEMDGEEDCLL